MPSDEAVLLAAARRYDAQALATIYDTYSEELYRYAYRLLGDAARAEDLIGETFSRFLGALERGGGPQTHLRAYLYRTTHNIAVDQLRRSNKEVVEDVVEARAEQTARNLESVVEHKLEQEQAITLMRQLTDDQRQVILLKFFQGMDNAETAETMEKTVGAVKALQHRALETLRRAIERSRAGTERAA